MTWTACNMNSYSNELKSYMEDFILHHGQRTPGGEIAFTAQPKIKSQSQIYRYGRSIFCLPHWPKISGFFDLCLYWVSVVRGPAFEIGLSNLLQTALFFVKCKYPKGYSVYSWISRDQSTVYLQQKPNKVEIFGN